MLKVIPCSGKYVEIVKLSDDVFEGLHPNGINVGYDKTGTAIFDLEVNYSFKIDSNKINHQSVFVTSKVEKIISYVFNEEEDYATVIFKTLNSTYQLNIHDA